MSVASNLATPHTCRAAGRTPAAATPRSASSSRTSSADGRPSGDPNTSRTTAVTPQPMARLPSTFSGSP